MRRARARKSVECQVCDRPVRFDSADDLEEKISTWVLHHYGIEGLEVHILTCPECGTLKPDTVFGAYQARIRAGRDLNYH